MLMIRQLKFFFGTNMHAIDSATEISDTVDSTDAHGSISNIADTAVDNVAERTMQG